MEFCGTSMVMVPLVVFSRFTTTYPSAVEVWELRSPAAAIVIFPIPHRCRLAVPTSG